MTADQLRQAGWQLIGPWHGRTLDQDRDDPDPAFQGCLDLETNNIIGVVEPAPAIAVCDGQPALSDQHQQHVTGPDRVADDLREVVARFDRVDVLEDLLRAQMLSKAVI